jgi:hypothetical protein
MTAQLMHADQVDFQDTTTDSLNTDGFSLLPGFIGFSQDAQRTKHEARHVYAMNDTDPGDAGISSRQDIPSHLAKMYR